MGLLEGAVKILFWYIVNLILIMLFFPYALAKYIFQASINIANALYVNIVNTLIWLFNLIVDFVNTYMGADWKKAEEVAQMPIDVIVTPLPNIPHQLNLMWAPPTMNIGIQMTFIDVIFLFIGMLIILGWNYIFFRYLSRLF